MSKVLFVKHDNSITGANIALDRIVSGYEADSCIRAIDRSSKPSMLDGVKFTLDYIFRSDYDLIYCNTMFSLEVLVLSKLLGKQCVWHIHESPTTFNRFKLRFICGAIFADEIRFVSKYQYNTIGKPFPKKSKIFYTPSNFDKGIHVKYEPSDNMRFGIVGSIDPNKNIFFALKLYSKLVQIFPSGSFIVLGKVSDAGYLKSLEEEIIRLDINVTFACYESPEKIYHCLDVLICCSHDESFGLVCHEAAMNGKAIISRELEAYNEVLAGYPLNISVDDTIANLADVVSFLKESRSFYYKNPYFRE